MDTATSVQYDELGIVLFLSFCGVCRAQRDQMTECRNFVTDSHHFCHSAAPARRIQNIQPMRNSGWHAIR